LVLDGVLVLALLLVTKLLQRAWVQLLVQALVLQQA
jgi:hypothetical protein